MDIITDVARPTGPSPPGHACLDDSLGRALRDDATVEAALAVVYRRHAPAVRVHLRRVGIGPDLVDDAVQEAMIQLWRQRATLPDGLAIRSWLVLVAARRALDALRRGGRHHVAWKAERVAGWHVDADPAAVALLRERVHQVRRLLVTLEPDERHLIELIYWRGWSQARVAAFLRVSPAALTSWAYRVRRYLAGAWLALEAGRQPPARRRARPVSGR